MKKFWITVFCLGLSGCIKIQKKSEAGQSEPVMEVASQPRVLVVNEIVSLNENSEIEVDELYLEGQARIYTNQFNLKIHARKLFVESGAIIQTFAENNSQAEINHEGHNGGQVQINIDDVAEGNLQVYMNGQHGGVGKIGWDGEMPFRGRMICNPGSGRKAGRSGSFFMEAPQSENFYITTGMSIARGGAVGQSRSDIISMSIEREKNPNHFKANNESCTVIPSEGADGSSGQICLKLQDSERPQCVNFK